MAGKAKGAKQKMHHIFGLTNSQERKVGLAISILIFAAAWFIYSPISNFWVSVNLPFAVGGTILIGLSFILGPAFRWFLPGEDPSEYRKMFGMLGFGLIAMHVLISFSFRSDSTFKAGNEFSIVVAALSFIIFALLAASSSGLVIESLGYEQWLSIQRLGYFALAFAFIHFYLIGGSRFLGSPLGQITTALVLLAILAKVVQMIRRK